MVPKKSGGMRPKINLKLLNKFAETIHFKMKTLQIVLNLLQKGSERCIFQHSDSSPTSELPDIYLKESEVRVSRPSFRTKIWSKNIHEASNVSSEVSSPSGNYLHRRFSVDGKQCTDSGGNRFIGSEHISTSRFSNQREEILPSTDSINQVLRLRDRYSRDDSFFTTRESLSNFQRNSKYNPNFFLYHMSYM